jgi:hypothetical protein
MLSRNLPFRWAAVIAVAAPLFGCGKKDEAPSTPVTPQAAAVTAQSTPNAANSSPGARREDGRSPDGPVNLPAGVYQYPPNGVLIGQGWDTFNSTGTTSSCVKVDAARLEQTRY